MGPTTHTPCSLDCEIKDIDDEPNKSHEHQQVLDSSYSGQLPTFAYISPVFSSRILETPRSIGETSSSHLFYSQEPFPWCEYHQQYGQPIYHNDDHDSPFASSPDHVLVAPLESDDTKTLLLPHAQLEFKSDDDDDPDTDHQTTTMIEFFSSLDKKNKDTIDKNDLDKFLLHDLSMIMDMSNCDDLTLLPYTQPESSISTPHHHQPSTPTSPLCPLPSVVIDHTFPDKPYTCDSCRRRFTRPQDCTRHIKSAHIKTKDFICHQTGCKGSFCRSDVFKRHLRAVHHLSNK